MTKRRFAAIDIGSNSVRLQIADTYRPPASLPVLETITSHRAVTRLGEGVFRKGRISRRAMKDTCAVLEEMARMCDAGGLTSMRVVATSAVRDAINSLEFVARARDVVGAPVEIISGPEEARLVHLGVHTRAARLPDKKTLIVDLGGGSAQLIYATAGTVHRVSRPIGAVRLREVFLKHDPPKDRELREMKAYIDDKLSIISETFVRSSIQRVIATSGTAATVVRAVNRLRKTDRERTDGLSASAEQVKSFYRKLTPRGLADRQRIRGVGSRRAEVIVPGVAVLQRILALTRQPAFTYSAAGVRDGIIADLANREHARASLNEQHFHVFLCHNSRDKPGVRQIARELKEWGIVAWLDEDRIRPGTRWGQALAKQIETIPSAAVFVGEEGIAPWQEMEMEALLRQFVSRQCPVIPVILPDAKTQPELPLFLGGMHWVDFRSAQPDPLEKLIFGITGERSYRRKD